MIGFGKKNAPRPIGPSSGLGIPTQKVMALSSQGLSEPDIVKRLRNEGHTPLEVDRAMKDAMRTGSGARAPPVQPSPAPAPPSAPPVSRQPQQLQMGPPPAPLPQEPPMMQFGSQNRFAPTDWGDEDDMDDDFDAEKVKSMPSEKRMGPGAFMGGMEEGFPPLPEDTEEPEPLPFAQAPLPKERDDRIRALKDRRRKEIEELTEEITEEKWKDLMSRVRLLEENLEKISGDIKNAPAQAGGGAPADLGPVREELANQKESLEEVNARIDSLEDVVKSSLSPMLESVRKFNKMSKVTHLRETPSATPHHHEGPRPPEQPPAEERQPEPKKEDVEAEPTSPPRYSPQAARE
jgi:hypothetical protein